MINTQYINLNMIPSGVMPVLYCSQYDVGRPLGVVVYNGAESVDLSGYTCTIEATRTDKTPVTAGVTTSGNIGVFETTATMTNQADTYKGKLVLTDGNGKRVASLAFVLVVTVRTMDEDAEEIEEDASLYQQYTGTVQTIIASIRADLAAEITARQNAISTEASTRAAAVSAEAAARQSADNTLQSNINAEASTRATQDASLQSQINQLIAPSGSAPSAAEVENARIGSDGTVYPTLGDAIRTQNSLLKSHLDAVRYPSNIFNPEDISDEHGYITDGNVFVSNESFRHSNYIAVHPYGIYMHPCYPGTFGTALVRVCHGYDANGTYVRFLGTLTGNNQYLVFTVPSNVVKIRVNVKYEDLTTFMLVDGNAYPDTYIPFEKVYLRDDVSFVHEQGVTVENINLFNNESTDIIDGSVISGYGEVTALTGFCVSGYIPIEPNVEYEVPIYESKLGVATRAVPIFNADKTYTQRVVGTYDSTTKRIKFTATNAAARYVRVNVAKRGDKALYVTPWHYYGIFMLTKAPFPSRYYSYGEKKVFDPEYYLPVEKENDYNALIGKTALFYGDSICYGDDLDGWAGRIGRKNRMTWENMGISGATFFKNSIAACIVEQPIPFESPDYIILEGGTNDADRVGNSISDPKPSAFGSYDWTNWGTSDASDHYGFDINTFCGAFEYMLKRITTQYPGVKIGYIVAQKMGRTNDYRPTANNRRFFFETAMDICKKWGVTYINLWDGSTLNPSNPSMYNSEQQGDTNYFYIDGQHLTAKGYDLISPQIEAWMKTL